MGHDPVELLRQLIRFDTTNPPGNEAECVRWIKDLCDGAGLETRVLAKDTTRPNLFARLPGRGAAPPLLLQGHVDVVSADGQSWRHDPFGAELIDGEIWGRGALDMKGGVAMMLGAILALAESAEPPPGDVLLCVLADEEVQGEYGARFVVEEHPELFAGVRHALGEFGGARTELAGLSAYPLNQLQMMKLLVNQSLYAQGLHQTQVLGTIFDGIARHTEEGYTFQRHATQAGFKQAVRERDEPFGDQGASTFKG